MTISAYFEREREVYVRNNSRPLGIISVDFSSEKRNDYFTVPKTTLPVVLTDIFPKDQIIASSDFRRLVSKGILELLSTEQYDHIMQTSKMTREEIARQVMELREKRVDLSEVVTETPPSDDYGPEVNSRIVQLVHLLTLHGSEVGVEGALPTPNAVVEELSTLNLTEADISFLMANTKGIVRKFAQDKASEFFKEEIKAESNRLAAEEQAVEKHVKRTRRQ